jgi:glucose-1-phosphate adenylyltransferase
MDYGAMLAFHAEKNADITVGCIEVGLDEAREFGVMGIDNEGRIQTFIEKPDNPAPMPDNPDHSLCSMGIYIFNRDFLIEQLIKDADTTTSSHDFGKNIIPALLERYAAYAYPFRDPLTGGMGYWRDVGTVDAFWSTNLELIGVKPELNLYDQEWPIWTYQEQLPPAKFVFDDPDRRGQAVDSMVSGGCIIAGATVSKSLLFSSVRLEPHTHVNETVILPEVEVGEHCRINKAVIDKGCIIPPGTTIGLNPEEDAKKYYVSPNGVTLVIPEMLGQEIHHVR